MIKKNSRLRKTHNFHTKKRMNSGCHIHAPDSDFSYLLPSTIRSALSTGRWQHLKLLSFWICKSVVYIVRLLLFRYWLGRVVLSRVLCILKKSFISCTGEKLLGKVHINVLKGNLTWVPFKSLVQLKCGMLRTTAFRSSSRSSQGWLVRILISERYRWWRMGAQEYNNQFRILFDTVHTQAVIVYCVNQSLVSKYLHSYSLNS